MKILEKINFRQTKYMLPAILYLPLLGGTYFIFDLFHTETAEIPDKALQTTEFLNPELPEAQIKDDGIGSKYENMAKAWGKIQDYSAVDNIDRDDPADNKEEYDRNIRKTTSPCSTSNSRRRLWRRKRPMPRDANRRRSRSWKKRSLKRG